MIFSGNNTFNFLEQNSLSFNFDLNINSNSTNFEFGFSGEGSGFKFKSIDNNIFDPKNLLIYAVASGDIISISGDIDRNYYSYFINSKPLLLNENKNDFSFNKFYFNNYSNPISGDLSIYGSTPVYQISLANEFVSGDGIVGVISNNSTNKSFKIFNISGYSYGFINGISTNKNILSFSNNPTGELLSQTSLNFTISTSGIDFKNYNNSFEIYIDTDFGKIIKTLNSTLISNRQYIYNFSDHFIYGNNTGNQNFNTDICVLNYTSFDLKNADKIFYNKPLSINLSYNSGYTGEVLAKIPASGYKDLLLTGFLSGSGYLSAFDSGIGSGLNVITNILETGILYKDSYDINLTYLSGNINQNIKINASGYSTGEYISTENFIATGNGVLLNFSNNFLSGLNYISGTLYNQVVSGRYSNSIYAIKVPYIDFITGAYITGTTKQSFSNIDASGIVTGFINGIFTGYAYANNFGSGYLIGSGLLTGTNSPLLVTGKISGDLNNTEYVENISQNIYGYKVATGVVNSKLFLTGYGLSTGNYIGTNYFGNEIIASGLNNFKCSGILNGTGFLTGYGTGVLYDKYNSSGLGYFSGFKFYNANIEKIYIYNTSGFSDIDGEYTISGLYSSLFGPIGSQDKRPLYVLNGFSNTFIRYNGLSGWIIYKNNIPIYRANENVGTPVDAKNWYSYPGYSGYPILSGKKSDYIDYNFNIFGTGFSLITGINIGYIDICSNTINKNYIFNNITGSTSYYSLDSLISGTGKLDVFNNLDFSLNTYEVTGIIAEGIDSGIFYYTGLSSGNLPLFISGSATLYTTFGFPVFTSVTGIFSSGYLETFTGENSGTKNLNINYNITTGSFGKNYSNLNVPPNLYFSYWQTDSSSLSSSYSPNGQYIYYNNINNYGAPINTSGYVGDYHYIIYDNISGWQIRRKASNSYGWSGLKTLYFPTSGWTGIGLSNNRAPGNINKIGFSDLGLRSIDPAYQNRNYFSLSENFYNTNTLFLITGSGSSSLDKTIIYSGKLNSGVGILPVIGNITGNKKFYITGFNKNILELQTGYMNNVSSLRAEIQYNNTGVLGSGLLSQYLQKTGYYEDSGILLPSTGTILSQVEFTYSGIIDSYSGYLNGATNRNLNDINLLINNSSGYITTGVYLRQNKDFMQDNSGRIKNLLPLSLYPITDYSGYQEYNIYATGYFKEEITGFINITKQLVKSGKFLTTGKISGEFEEFFSTTDSGFKYVYKDITGLLINPALINSNVLITGSYLGSGTYDGIAIATGSFAKDIFVTPITTIGAGSAITGFGFTNISLNRNLPFNVISGIAYYNNPYLESINNNIFTGYIDPFIATGNVAKISNEFFTGLIDSKYTKTFLNSFSIATGFTNADGSSVSDLININSINNTGYYSFKNINSGIDNIIISIIKNKHYNASPIYANLVLSGQNSSGNLSVINESITGGLF